MSAPAPSSPPSPRRAQRSPGPLSAWGSLSTAQKRTAAAALVLLVSLGAPWYATEVVFSPRAGQRASVTHGTMSGFAAFSFVEAAVLLVAAAVLVLTWARATGRAFSLPGRDGTFVTIAAGWIGLLVIYRLFDRPDGQQSATSTTLVGLSWGIFASLAAVGLLLATGLDQRRSVPSRRAVRDRERGDDGPVVDPADVVRPRAGEEDAGWTVAPPRPLAADGRPREQHDGAPRPTRADRSARRPAGHGDDTRMLGRDDAAALLRDAGLGADAPARAAGADEDPTRAVPRGEDPTRAVRRDEGEHDGTERGRADDAPTRAVRRDEAPARRAAPDEAPTRVAGHGESSGSSAPAAGDSAGADDEPTRVRPWRRRGRHDDGR